MALWKRNGLFFVLETPPYWLPIALFGAIPFIDGANACTVLVNASTLTAIDNFMISELFYTLNTKIYLDEIQDLI
jgi:hypothetical protein